MSVDPTTPTSYPYLHSSLVLRYFCEYLMQLLIAQIKNDRYDGYFVKVAYSPDNLEQRLQKIDPLGLTKNIVDEVGNIADPIELDRRLMDAWAELRVADQLQREGYYDIQKVTEIADFVAMREEHQFAFQVTRVNKLLANEISRRNPPNKRSSLPYGTSKDIHDRLDEPTGYLFWDRLQEKNGKFKKWPNQDSTRCVVLVTNQEPLQDTLQRHIVCQQLRQAIHDLTTINFEELLWLPDNGNGALFKIGSTIGETECWVDWKDEFPGPATNYQPADVNQVERHKIDLDADVPLD